MKNECKITIVGKSRNQEDEISMFTLGKHFWEDNSEIIEYEDKEEQVKTMIAITGNIVTVNKYSDSDLVTMTFEKATLYPTEMKTPVGNIKVSIRSRNVKIERFEAETSVLLDYSICLESGDILNDTTLHIHCIDSQ